MIGSSLMLTIASVGFMIPGLVRTKMAGLTLGEQGIALFGQLSQMQTLLITIGGAGLATATRVILSRDDFRDRDRDTTQSWLLWIPAALSTVLVSGVAFCAVPIAHLLLGNSDYSIEVALAASGIPVAVMGQILLATAQARREPKRLVIASLASALVGGVLVAALMLTRDRFFAASSLVLGPAVQLLMIVLLCGAARRGFITRPKINRPRRKEVITLAWSSAVLGGFAAASEMISRSRVVHLRGLSEIAPYQPVVLIVTTSMSLILGAIATSSLIELAKSRDVVWIGARIAEVATRVIPLLGIIISMGILLTPLAISLLYVPSMVGGSLPLVIAAFAGEPLRAFAWIAGACLLPLGFRRQWLVVGVTTVTIQVCIATGLAAAWGVYALVAGLLGASIWTTLATLYVLRRNGILVPRRITCVAASIALLVGGLPFLSIALLSNAAPGAAAAILLLALYLLVHSRYGIKFGKGRR